MKENDAETSDTLQPDPTSAAALLSGLIRCPSVTPDEGGALAFLESVLTPLGFSVERPVFEDVDTPDVENLLATCGESGPHLVFAGHTDVVPPGDVKDWRHNPFSGTVENDEMFGRGAVDMKGGIAAFVAAVARFAKKGDGELPGRVSLLITGDEEGPSVNGTPKLLKWAEEKGLSFDACLVGEPTNPHTLGEMIKIGRRGSLSAEVRVTGIQGHVAYPHLADNPLRTIAAIAQALMAEPLDAGSERFPASNLEITSIDTGNPSVNVIPARSSMFFNVRFSDVWTPDTLKAELSRRIEAAAKGGGLRSRDAPADVEIVWRERPAEAFLTKNEPLVAALVAAVEETTGRTPSLSTSGGTSDARYIKDHCPVVEFGLVGETMHMIDERVPLADLESLTRTYEAFISRWFASHA